MLNKIVIMGRLTHDPEMRQTGSGTSVTSFSLAVERDYSGRDGGEKQTDFIDVVAWRHTAEFVDKYFAKGDMAAVSGRLQIRDWTDKDGNKRRSARSWRTASTSAAASAERQTQRLLHTMSARSPRSRRRPTWSGSTSW